MKTKLIKLYTIEELKEANPEGYENAYNVFSCEKEEYYPWTSEVTNSLEKFLSMFECEWCSWDCLTQEVDYQEGEIEIYNESTEEYDCYSLDEIEGDLLHKFLNDEYDSTLKNWNRCPLTGVVFDTELLKPFYEFLEKAKYQDYTLKDLINESCVNLMEMVNDDISYLKSEEHFLEESAENDWYYTINGEIVY